LNYSIFIKKQQGIAELGLDRLCEVVVKNTSQKQRSCEHQLQNVPKTTREKMFLCNLFAQKEKSQPGRAFWRSRPIFAFACGNRRTASGGTVRRFHMRKIRRKK